MTNAEVTIMSNTSNTSQLTNTTGNLRLVSNFMATNNNNIKLRCDGTNWYEVARSNNV